MSVPHERRIPPEDRIPPEIPPEHILEDQIRSLRTAVALLGALAVVATGLAVWALLTAESTDDRTPASAAQVRALDERLDDLESEVERAPSSDDLSELRDAQKALEDDVERLQRQAPDAKTAVDELRGDVRDLEERVDALEQQQAEPTPSPTPEG